MALRHPVTRTGLSKQSDERAGVVFDALADPTRRAVLSLVGREGPLTATQLATRLPVTRQAVTKHLDTLRAAGLVDGQREGRELRFVARAEPLDTAMAWLADAGSKWDRRLGQLEERLVVKRSRPTA
jgi:DNA-binding transcriptional ArsR family regulator